MNLISRGLLILLLVVLHHTIIAQRTITAKVIDSATKKPIKEAFVSIPTTNKVTTTNFLGFFQMQVDSMNYLEIISPGYIAARIEIPQVNNFHIALTQETNPQYQGGWVEFYKFLQQNIRYPEEARKKGIQGRVYACFQIDSLGSIKQLTIMKDIGSGCGNIVIEAIKSLPNDWVPAYATTKFVIPVRFIFTKDPIQVEKTESIIDTSEAKLLNEIIVTAPRVE